MFYIKRGRFKSRFDSSHILDPLKIIRWKIGSLFKKNFFVKKHSPFFAVNMQERLKSSEDFICFLGHASVLVQLCGKRILFDPVFGDIPFYKRITPFVYDIKSLFPIDAVAISHLHYDHFDIPSLKKLLCKDPLFIIPLGMRKYMKRVSLNLKLKELSWFESTEIGDIKITFVPAKHWGARGPFDKNRSLWGGYVVKSPDVSVYFAGDSGYDEHFKIIGERFKIDIALLPIGAYEPRYVMKNHHLNPKEAYKAFLDLKAKVFIPIHFGTFVLSDEGVYEPVEKLNEVANKKDILYLNQGEIFFIKNSFSSSKM